MEKFDQKFRGYSVEQVNRFIDKVIIEYESLLNKSKQSEQKLIQSEMEIKTLKDKLAYYENIESTLNRAIFSAESKCDQIKKLAYEESNSLIENAKKNANRITNEALLKASKAQEDTDRLRRNIVHLKRRLRTIVEGQLEVIEEIETIDLN